MLDFILTGFADEAAKELDGQIAALKRNGMSYFEPRGIDGKNIADFTVEEAINTMHSNQCFTCINCADLSDFDELEQIYKHNQSAV